MHKLSMLDMTHILLSLGVMLALARFLAEVAKRFNQPGVIGEIVAGIILGPTLLGSLFPDAVWFLRPTEESKLVMNGFTSIAIVLYLLVAGLDVDLSKIARQGRVASFVSTMGILVPFVLGFTAVILFPRHLGYQNGVDIKTFALFFATALSISALPVIAKTLLDLNYYRTDVGMVIITSAIINDLVGWMIFSVILGKIGGVQGGGLPIGIVIVLVLLFTAAMLTVGRWLINKVLPRILAYASWPGGVLGFAVSLGLLGAAFTEWLGIHAVFGAFMVGVALGDSEHMRKRTKETLDQFVSFIFAPLFFVGIGLKVDLVANFDPLLTLIVIALAFIGKVVGCGIGARLGGMPKRESLAVGFGMNARGAMEIILALLAMEHGLIGEKMFVALVVMAMTTSVLSGPMMQIVLKSKRKRHVGDYLHSRAFINPLKAQDVKGAINEMSGVMAGVCDLDANAVNTAVLERERIVPTGLGFGVAIPHARIVNLRRPAIGVAISKDGVDFNATDGKPAKLMFIILTPQEDLTSQVEILSEISRMMKNHELCERMKKARSYTELLGLFRTMEV
jgi:Kef-type K+ transport system membrane component KefB/mannitol/fructose-specific phosphotransferase system IIA component (Ntr-type)